MAYGGAEFTDPFKQVFQLEPARTALVLIDLQNASASRREGMGRALAQRGEAASAEWRFTRLEQVALPNVQRLLAFFRQHRLPIVHVAIGSQREDYSDMPVVLRAFARAAGNRIGTRVNDFLPEVTPQPGEPIIRKTTNSAFLSSSIDAVLRAMNVQYLIFVGVSTNACVDGTARDASDLSYSCVIVEDACSGISEELHTAALRNFSCMAGLVMSTDDVLAELSAAL